MTEVDRLVEVEGRLEIVRLEAEEAVWVESTLEMAVVRAVVDEFQEADKIEVGRV